MKENKKPAYIHTSVRIKLVSPSEYPRPTSRDGVATPDTQPNTTGKVSITTLIRIRQEKIMFSFQNKKVLLLRSMLVRTPAIRPNAATEIHLFTTSVADRMRTWQGPHIFSITVYMTENIIPHLLTER